MTEIFKIKKQVETGFKAFVERAGIKKARLRRAFLIKSSGI